jgi:rSAM/selenodomain-associated transferase 1
LQDDLIIIFSKAPILGKVKRRLAAETGDQSALLIHQKLFVRTIAVVNESKIRKKIYLSEKMVDFDHPYLVQAGDNLGERMAAAFQQEFEEFKRICLIGSDCLDLATTDLLEAFESLNNHDLVLGPARDGGYYLIAMKSYIPELFESITWGTEQVLQETTSIANRLSLKSKLLAVRKDVDHLSDLPANWKLM